MLTIDQLSELRMGSELAFLHAVKDLRPEDVPFEELRVALRTHDTFRLDTVRILIFTFHPSKMEYNDLIACQNSGNAFVRDSAGVCLLQKYHARLGYIALLTLASSSNIGVRTKAEQCLDALSVSDMNTNVLLALLLSGGYDTRFRIKKLLLRFEPHQFEYDALLGYVGSRHSGIEAFIAYLIVLHFWERLPEEHIEMFLKMNDYDVTMSIRARVFPALD